LRGKGEGSTILNRQVHSRPRERIVFISEQR
jgi:hypothetical protein